MRKTNVSIAVSGLAARDGPRRLRRSRATTHSSELVLQLRGRTVQRRASSGGAVDGKGAKVGIILPDTTSSPRWVTADPEALKADCKKFNLDCNIQNAGGSAAQDADHRPADDRRQDQGPDDRRPRPGLRREDRAGGRQERRHPRRLRPPHPGWRRGALRLLRQRQGRRGAGPDPDPVPAGRRREEREVRRDRRCARPTTTPRCSSRATTACCRKTAGWTKVGEQTGNWDAPTAGRVFSSMLGKNPDIKAVMVANDTMAGAVITDLKRQSLNGKVAVSGQDASAEGLQHILDGDQCFTIYKPSTAEADPAIEGDRPARQRPGARHQGRDDHGPADQEEGPVHPRHPGRHHHRQRGASRSTTSTPRRTPSAPARTPRSARKAGVELRRRAHRGAGWPSSAQRCDGGHLACPAQPSRPARKERARP